MSLPNGYTRLEYIESTGTQYINTGFNPNQNTRVDIDAELTAFTTYPTVFGCRKNNTNLFWVFASRSNTVEFGFGTFRQLANKTILKRTFISAQKNVLFVDGNATITATSDDFISEWPLYLFCCNSNRNPQYRANMKLYSCQIYDDGVLVRNFIPCKSASGVIGLWDSVNEAFYKNAGNDEFTAGEERAAEDHHKCLIDGTSYAITTGKCLVNGVNYDIKKGRTLVDGTGKDILLAKEGNIYGVSWNGSSTTKWTRTDDAEGFADPVAAVNNGNGSSPFDDLLPWSGMEIVEDAECGTLVSIPKYWYKWTKTDAQMTLQISDSAQDGFYVSPAHADRGDGNGERDVVYVGRYHCGSDYKSSADTPLASITRATARTNIHNLGGNVWQYDFAMYWTIMMLYLVEYADWNSQNTIGYGCGNNSAKEAQGATDVMTYHTGTIAAKRTTYAVGIQYRYIEGLWSNVFDWCDGIYFLKANVYAIKNPSNFSDTDNGTEIGTRPTSSNYISTWSMPSATGFEYALYPSAVGGSASTYVCDYCIYNSLGVVLDVGGAYTTHQNRGAFALFGSNMASGANGAIGCRLQKLP